ncbi:MAG: ribulose-phosphate 3-epimerase [Longimicrobiales bacterium]
MIKIAPSILSADFARLADGIAEAEAGGADWIHVDVMDGHFVPNLTIGPPVVKAIRRVTELPLDVHLMIEKPDQIIDAFIDAGANILTVHYEAVTHLHRLVEYIRSRGVQPGVSLNPSTPVHVLDEILPYVDLVLIMSVNPGFSGQRFIPTSAAKIARLRRTLEERSLWPIEIEVDGGVAPETIGDVVAAGATAIVAGAAVYNEGGTVADNIAALRQAAVSAV